MLLFEQEEEAE